jgi:predicted phage-related endonuclease
MTQKSAEARKFANRRYFVGGSDARIIMGDEALIRLWRDKRGEVEPEEPSRR